jgi:hypothetical protein
MRALPYSWQRTTTHGGGAQWRHVEAAPFAGADIWPAGELQGRGCFFLFCFGPIAFSFLFRGFIAFLFSIQGPMYKIFDS